MLRAHEAYGVGLGGLRDGRLSVDLELGEVGPGAEPYPRDACWAKPDLDAATDAMRQLYDHPDVATELGRRARASVPATHDATTAAASFDEPFGALTGAGADR